MANKKNNTREIHGVRYANSNIEAQSELPADTMAANQVSP